MPGITVLFFNLTIINSIHEFKHITDKRLNEQEKHVHLLNT